MRKTSIQTIASWVLLALTILVGAIFLSNDMLLLRLILGLGLGYALSRSYMGFAGSVNRAYNTGSTKLMRTLMLMFLATSIIVGGFLIGKEPSAYDLWINPINLGLLIGGFLFGFGMSLSTCCASGVLTDLITSFPRAVITLFFFMAGVFLGFPVQKTMSFVTNTWFSSSSYESGVYFPDFFGGNTVLGILGAILVTALLALIVIKLSFSYERKRRNEETYRPIATEEVKLELPDAKDGYCPFNQSAYDRIFVKSWPLAIGASVIIGLYLIMFAATKAGWGASSPYGGWFGRLLMLFGVSAESVANFTHMPVKFFAMPFFDHPINVQNFGILIGTLIYMLMSRNFVKTWQSTFKIKFYEVFIYALGGFTMGFGTRLANGCNVGALYTPISNFSLSGWVFLVVMVLGAVVGNTFNKKTNHCPL